MEENSEYKPKNFDEKAKSIPKNIEHFESLQNEVDKERNEYINSLSPENRKKFKQVEKIIAELDNSCYQFILYVKPTKNEPTPLRYQRFHPKGTDPYCKESQEIIWTFCRDLIQGFCCFITLMFNHIGFALYHPANRGLYNNIIYENGKYLLNPLINPPKPPENGDEWKEN